MIYSLILLFNLGMPEIVLILLVVLLLFGASRLPNLAKSIAVSIKEFKKAKKEIEKDDDLDHKIKKPLKKQTVKKTVNKRKASKAHTSTGKKERTL